MLRNTGMKQEFIDISTHFLEGTTTLKLYLSKDASTKYLILYEQIFCILIKLGVFFRQINVQYNLYLYCEIFPYQYVY